jgi:CDP-diacylglycerol--serine O-phosphatidyltransferase
MQLFNIPNLLTLINLFAGCMAILFVMGGNPEATLICTAVSLVADFFDGMSARALKVSSGIGKELDSLADVVSFGVVPGFIFKFLFFDSLSTHFPTLPDFWLTLVSNSGFIFALFAALRLAKFNIDTRQSDGFIGLATPAATIFVVGLYQLFNSNAYGLYDIVSIPYVLFTTFILLCFLMIAELPMFSFKFKNYGWKGNELRFGFIAICILLLVVLKLVALPLIILLYILTSIIQKQIAK